jgi:hypothetical protein
VAAAVVAGNERWSVDVSSYSPAPVEVPLFYQGQGEVARAQAEARRQTELYDGLSVRIRSAARTAAERLSVARERARYFREVLLPVYQPFLDSLLKYLAGENKGLAS